MLQEKDAQGHQRAHLPRQPTPPNSSVTIESYRQLHNSCRSKITVKVKLPNEGQELLVVVVRRKEPLKHQHL